MLELRNYISEAISHGRKRSPGYKEDSYDGMIDWLIMNGFTQAKDRSDMLNTTEKNPMFLAYYDKETEYDEIKVKFYKGDDRYFFEFMYIPESEVGYHAKHKGELCYALPYKNQRPFMRSLNEVNCIKLLKELFTGKKVNEAVSHGRRRTPSLAKRPEDLRMDDLFRFLDLHGFLHYQSPLRKNSDFVDEVEKFRDDKNMYTTFKKLGELRVVLVSTTEQYPYFYTMYFDASDGTMARIVLSDMYGKNVDDDMDRVFQNLLDDIEK